MKSKIFSGIFAAVLLLANTTAWSVQQDGQSLFEKRCAACHMLPSLDKQPPEGWEKRLDTMAPLARLKADQKENILEYILAHSQQSAQTAALSEDKILFEEKCSGCHGLDRIFLEPLTFEDRRHIVLTMQELGGTSSISDKDVEQILVYLDVAVAEASAEAKAQAITKATKPLPADASAEQIFQARCSACHPLERVYALLGKEGADQNIALMHTVIRMRDKAPQWMTAAEAAKIIEFLKSLGQPAG